jgi:hypothetical protein
MCLPIMGEISDRIGRRPLLAAVALALLTSYPALSWLVNAPSFGRLMAVELRFAFPFASYTAPSIVFLTEIMPPASGPRDSLLSIAAQPFSAVSHPRSHPISSLGSSRCHKMTTKMASGKVKSDRILGQWQQAVTNCSAGLDEFEGDQGTLSLANTVSALTRGMMAGTS